jgi:hypothetical protein
MASRPSRGNDGAHSADNHLVHALAELMDVVRDLCRFAAVFHAAGSAPWAEALVEQCADLLAHRARLRAAHGRDGAQAPAKARAGTEWTN